MSRLKLVMLLLAAAGLGGCSYFSAQEQLNRADQAFDQIDRGGAAETSPYHYYASEQYLERSRRENRSSDFVSAERFATRSLEHSSRALDDMGQMQGGSSDSWSTGASDDSWGSDATDAGASDDSWGSDDAWAEPVETAPTVEIVPVPMGEGYGAAETDPEVVMPDVIEVPDSDPGQADFVIERMP